MARRKAQVVRLTAAGPVVEPERGVIAELTDLLARAKHGEIKGIGCFVVTRTDGVSTFWESGCACQNDMVAGAALLQWRVTQAAVE